MSIGCKDIVGDVRNKYGTLTVYVKDITDYSKFLCDACIGRLFSVEVQIVELAKEGTEDCKEVCTNNYTPYTTMDGEFYADYHLIKLPIEYADETFTVVDNYGQWNELTQKYKFL